MVQGSGGPDASSLEQPRAAPSPGSASGSEGGSTPPVFLDFSITTATGNYGASLRRTNPALLRRLPGKFKHRRWRRSVNPFTARRRWNPSSHGCSASPFHHAATGCSQARNRCRRTCDYIIAVERMSGGGHQADHQSTAGDAGHVKQQILGQPTQGRRWSGLGRLRRVPPSGGVGAR